MRTYEEILSYLEQAPELYDAFKLTFGIHYWSKLTSFSDIEQPAPVFREWCEDMRNPHNFIQFLLDEDHVPDELTIQLDSMRDDHHLNLIGLTLFALHV
jgi:hypothetical protein